MTPTWELWAVDRKIAALVRSLEDETADVEQRLEAHAQLERMKERKAKLQRELTHNYERK